MMPMSPENALYLANQRAEDLRREAEADRCYVDAQLTLGHSTGRFVAYARATLAAMMHVGQHETQVAITLKALGSAIAVLPIVQPAAT
jgi:hypothetical protein